MEDLEIWQSAGNLQIGLIFDDNPTSKGDYQIRFSKHGVKKAMIFDKAKVQELKNIFTELDQEVDIELIYECVQCGSRYAKSEPKEPYKCECGSRKFRLIDGFDPIDKKTGDILISVYIDDSLELEIADKTLKTEAEIFDEIDEDSINKAANVFREIQSNLEEYRDRTTR